MIALSGPLLYSASYDCSDFHHLLLSLISEHLDLKNALPW